MNAAQKIVYNFTGLRAVSKARDGDETFTKAQVDEMIATQVKGLKDKNTELLGNISKFRDDLKKFDGVNIESLRALQERLDKDDDLRLLAEGKSTEVIERHTERMRTAHQAELAKMQKDIEAANGRADKYKAAVLDNHIRASATGLHKGAVEDALLHARNLFKLDDEGKPVQLDQDGKIVMGKDGKTPFGPGEWFEQMKEEKPHWFPNDTSGSGSGGAREAGTGGKTMKRATFDKLDPHKRAQTIKDGVDIVD